jgi:hypothetical protein
MAQRSALPEAPERAGKDVLLFLKFLKYSEKTG